MTNAYGSVVMHSVITTDSRYVVCVESDNLLVWDLKTQSINHRLSAPNVHQILFVDSEKLLVEYTKNLKFLILQDSFLKVNACPQQTTKMNNFLGVVFRQIDTPDVKMARVAFYKMPDLVFIYSHDYQCRAFRNIVALRVRRFFSTKFYDCFIGWRDGDCGCILQRA